jgi:hypothetical protein
MDGVAVARQHAVGAYIIVSKHALCSQRVTNAELRCRTCLRDSGPQLSAGLVSDAAGARQALQLGDKHDPGLEA